MKINVDIDKKLLDEVKSLRDFKNQRELITAALRELINHEKRTQLIEMGGTIDYYEDDPKMIRLERSKANGSRNGKDSRR